MTEAEIKKKLDDGKWQEVSIERNEAEGKISMKTLIAPKPKSFETITKIFGAIAIIAAIFSNVFVVYKYSKDKNQEITKTYSDYLMNASHNIGILMYADNNSHAYGVAREKMFDEIDIKIKRAGWNQKALIDTFFYFRKNFLLYERGFQLSQAIDSIRNDSCLNAESPTDKSINSKVLSHYKLINQINGQLHSLLESTFTYEDMTPTKAMIDRLKTLIVLGEEVSTHIKPLAESAKMNSLNTKNFNAMAVTDPNITIKKIVGDTLSKELTRTKLNFDQMIFKTIEDNR